jgi:hypothetical protein
MRDPAAEGGGVRELFVDVEGIVVAGGAGEKDDVRLGDRLGEGGVHAPLEILDVETVQFIHETLPQGGRMVGALGLREKIGKELLCAMLPARCVDGEGAHDRLRHRDRDLSIGRGCSSAANGLA